VNPSVAHAELIATFKRAQADAQIAASIDLLPQSRSRFERPGDRLA